VNRAVVPNTDLNAGDGWALQRRLAMRLLPVRVLWPDFEVIALVIPKRYVSPPILAVGQFGLAVCRIWLRERVLSTLRVVLGAAAPAAEVDDHSDQ
jgi:hypothetical protein